MRIAYVTSGFTVSFITNEMEAHRQSGWEILPLGSCEADPPEKLSVLQANWSKRGIFRPGLTNQIIAILKELAIHPVKFAKMLFWLLQLFRHDKLEFAKAIYELPSACYFVPYVRKSKTQHLHVHFASRPLSLGLMLGLLTNLRVSCTVHAFDIFTRSSGSLFWRLSQCCFIASISKYNIEYLREHCGDSVADLCQVVHCGIDLEKFRSLERTPQEGYLLCIANLRSKKGQDIAIRACKKLADENICFTLKFIGEGPWRKRLQKRIDSLGLNDRVMLLGTIPNDRLMPMLNKAWLLVLPCVINPFGDRDGIPVAMMEAMACQVPVVSTYVSGIPELVEHNVSGLLVNERDPDALANAIKELLHDREKVMNFGKVGQKCVQQHFNIKKTSAQLRELIEKVNQG